MAEVRKATFGAEMNLPVRVGFGVHVMGKARIDIDGNDVTIKIESKGQDGLILADFLTGGEPVELTFAAIPVQPHSPRQ